jgi:hypothetical protein
MKRIRSKGAVRTAPAYEAFLRTLYAGVKRRPAELVVPPVKAIAVTGSEPPAGAQYQNAISALYGVGYSLKMGLKFRKLPRPAGYFDYRVGALETFWWSTGDVFEIDNAKTLRWQAYLMVPAYVTKRLVDGARTMAKAKHPDVPYDAVTLTTIREGRAVQILHVGPYNQPEQAIGALLAYAAEHGLSVTGKHHEIYISDPRRTKPEKLKTVIRVGVTPTRHSV